MKDIEKYYTDISTAILHSFYIRNDKQCRNKTKH